MSTARKQLVTERLYVTKPPLSLVQTHHLHTLQTPDKIPASCCHSLVCLQVLVVFNQMDLSADTLVRASEKLGFDVTFCDSYDKALEEFQARTHDLILIDTRSPKLDYDTLCR